MKLGIRIRNLREEKNINQKDFAKMIDLNVNVLSRIELGRQLAIFIGLDYYYNLVYLLMFFWRIFDGLNFKEI